MLAGMRKKHAKYTPLRFYGCGPSLLKPKRTPQALPAGFRSVVILRTCVAQGQIADGGSGCGREVRPTGHHAPGVDGPGEDTLQHGLELLVAADRQRTAVAGHEVDVVALGAGVGVSAAAPGVYESQIGGCKMHGRIQLCFSALTMQKDLVLLEKLPLPVLLSKIVVL